jgi:hypothetical protein
LFFANEAALAIYWKRKATPQQYSLVGSIALKIGNFSLLVGVAIGETNNRLLAGLGENRCVSVP